MTVSSLIIQREQEQQKSIPVSKICLQLEVKGS